MSAEKVIEVSHCYATALLKAAEEEKSVDRVGKDLSKLFKVISRKETIRFFLKNPTLNRQEQEVHLQPYLKGFSKLTANFIGLVIHNRRLAYLLDIIVAFLKEVEIHKGYLKAHVTSTKEMSKSQLQTLTKLLKDGTGKLVEIDNKVDPSLLGGMAIRFGTYLIDNSLKTHLHNLHSTMKGHP
ncbi:MAG: ATP synthase F1 subunit delta [Alphaproteobacteria bacterium]|jgi:F-type H+-transporting ATPase subunit delta|nr:ATP synthase F1 subunit delta [Alphaproteobacteria bacterium]MBT5389613.1 ATP synthase F1 subunit delta [Alphaproteobacteria bacterium]MBT5540177.1 ATP synthase F1 subunit delta [Alphaproteobacteria bacterium]MBT5654857.1 ATP synthase F1 subunit delta [Alphaproteobacteria bacterium]